MEDVLLSIGDSNGQIEAFDAAQDAECNDRADSILGQETMEIVEACHGLLIECDDDVAFAEAGVTRRAVAFEGDDEYARRLREAVEARHAAEDWNVLPGDAEISASDAAVSQERWQDRVYGVDGN